MTNKNIIYHNKPLYIQNDSTFPTKHQPDDNKAEQFLKMKHEYFYQKTQHHVMIFQ